MTVHLLGWLKVSCWQASTVSNLNEKVVFPFDSRSGPPRNHVQGTKSEKEIVQFTCIPM